MKLVCHHILSSARVRAHVGPRKIAKKVGCAAYRVQPFQHEAVLVPAACAEDHVHLAADDNVPSTHDEAPRVRRNRTSGSLNPHGFEVRAPNHRGSVPHERRRGCVLVKVEGQGDDHVQRKTAGQEESNLWVAKPPRI